MCFRILSGIMAIAMLCALSAGSRCVELSNLDTRYLIRRPDGMYFKLMKHKKNRSNTVYPGEVVFASILDKTICPCYCIEAYLERTNDWSDTPEDPLFRGTIAPHKGVSSCTISRYITHCIQESGVITGSHNMGHTARGVAASMAAFKGLSTQEIMNAVEWKSEMTYRLFYKQPTSQIKFAKTLSKNT